MDVYLVFSGQNPQVHAFCKAGNLRKWAVYINNEALSPMVISLPNKFLEFCVEKCQLLSNYQQISASPASSWELAFGAKQQVKRANVAYGLTCLRVSFYRFSISLVALDFCNYPLAAREYDGSRPLP